MISAGDTRRTQGCFFYADTTAGTIFPTHAGHLLYEPSGKTSSNQKAAPVLRKRTERLRGTTLIRNREGCLVIAVTCETRPGYAQAFTGHPPKRPSPCSPSKRSFSRRTVLSKAATEVLLLFFGIWHKAARKHRAAIMSMQLRRRRSGVFLLFGHVDDLHAVIISAMLAYTVGELLFVALRAFHDAGQAQLPVGATAAAAGLGHFSLGKSHSYTSSFRPPERIPGFKSSAFANVFPG